jgi:hypothetical protein
MSTATHDRQGRADQAGRHGLSKTQAEEKLREMMIAEFGKPTGPREMPTVGQLGVALVAKLEHAGRKLPSTGL